MPMDRPGSVIQRGFTGGELAPVLHARADSPRYVDGLRTCKNFMVLRHGAVANRAGLRFVNATKTTSSNVRLEKYISETVDESILIEVGISYFRFYKNGALIELGGPAAAYGGATPYVPGDLVSSAGVNYYCIAATTGNAPPNVLFWYPLTGEIYEVPHTYTTTGLIGSWQQSGNVILITHRLHDPRELVYLGDTNWVLRLATTEPTLTAPAGLALAPSAGARTFSYVVTSAAAETYEESLPSTPATDPLILAPTDAAPHALTWTADPDAAEYYVYCDPHGNGVFGYVGTAASNSFNNPGTDPDFSITPPLDRTPFVSADTRPHVGAHYQQRRFYGGSNATPEGIEGSRSGFFNNFGRSSPLQDDDALTFRMVGRQFHPIRHMLGLKTLVVFTDGGAWAIGQDKTPLTPSNLPAEQQTYAGAAPDVPPVVIGTNAIYLQARGKIVRDLRFDQQVEGLNGRDLTLFASHLVDKYTITRMDYAETPHSIVWCVRSDGVLLGLTYVPELDVWGWHRHDTDGDIEQVCTVPEAGEDAVYLIVRRTIGGVSVRYIERMNSRELVTFDEDCFFVDSGLSYSGAPATVFSGLDHLEGELVAVVADGEMLFAGTGGTAAEITRYTVTGGEITLAAAASNVHIGLRYVADFETLDLDVQGSDIRDKKKRVSNVTILVDKSSNKFQAGTDSTDLNDHDLSGMDVAEDEHTGQVEMVLSTTWNEHGRVFVRQPYPLPLTILGIIPNALTEG